MPNRDKTGPNGEGPRTGRQMGDCKGAKPTGRRFARRNARPLGRGLGRRVNQPKEE